MVGHCNGCGTCYEANDLYVVEIEQPDFALEEGYPEEIEMQLCEWCIAKISDVLELTRQEYEAPMHPPEAWSP
jgi:hypothetical protein